MSQLGESVRSALLTPGSVPAYLRTRWPDLWARLAAEGDPRAMEVGDGNLNLVFVVRNDIATPGLVLKQAMPYVRLVGESWPLTAERAAAEARAYEVYAGVAPDLVPAFYGYDPERHVLVMEDLSGMRVWRGALNDGEIHSAAAAAIGTLIGRVAFATSDFGMDTARKKELAAATIDPELCRITEDLVFTEPYQVHERNRYGASLEPAVAWLRDDPDLRQAISELKLGFMTRAEALIHGDLHTGSVMVGDGRALAFDLEFAFYGPVGFDLGAQWGNFLIAAARAERSSAPVAFRRHVAGLLAASWSGFSSAFRACWPDRLDRSFDDRFLEHQLQAWWMDGLGYAAAKAIRRVVGIAQVTDLTTLPEPARTSAGEAILHAARRLALERASLPDPIAAWQVVEQEIAR